MNYIKLPNLPDKPVTLAVIDGRADKKVLGKIGALDIKVIKTHAHPGVYESICCHPDIMINHVGGDTIVYAPGTDVAFLRALSQYGFKLIPGQHILGIKYPYNVAYNAARVGKFVFHNLKYMDGVLRREYEKVGIDFIHVNQGYSKCSIAVVNENSIITADAGIAKAAESKGIDTLFIEAEGGILLPGMSCGFVGGSTGLIDKDKMFFTGSIEKIRCAGKIVDFLSSKGIKIVEASDEHIIDVGSIIPLLTK
jgi:hypothetical protein